MRGYWTCPHCGANLDHGECCDCDFGMRTPEAPALPAMEGVFDED